jgi:hypothetical protein
VWNYEHERLIKEFSEAKTIVEEYNKSYWKYRFFAWQLFDNFFDN